MFYCFINLSTFLFLPSLSVTRYIPAANLSEGGVICLAPSVSERHTILPDISATTIDTLPIALMLRFAALVEGLGYTTASRSGWYIDASSINAELDPACRLAAVVKSSPAL